jgi:transposase-like protein
MTTDHRRADTRMAQEALLDEPSFLKEVLERVLQELLEAEMTQHIGAATLRACREPHRPP